MAATYGQPPTNPLMIPELARRVINFIDRPVDLLHCSMVNSIWSTPALQRLYQGSISDMRFCTPDLTFLDSICVQSEERFAQYMGYAKHLTIATKQDPNVTHPVFKHKQMKFWDILCDRTGDVLLQRPKGKGPISLAIPSVLTDEEVPYLRDAILHPDLRSLIIDHEYCKLLRSGLHSGKDRSTPPRLSNIAALSVYQTDEELRTDDLSVCLEHSDLKMFCLDIYEMLPGVLDEEMKTLLQRLWRHRSLRILALWTGTEDETMGKICADLEVQSQSPCWPELGALYLIETDDYWLQTIPLLKKLQVLELANQRTWEVDIVGGFADSISRCHSLCSLELVIGDAADPELIATIAKGCPMLRRLSVSLDHPMADLTEDVFSRSVRHLSYLEVLLIDVPFEMEASALQDLSTCCPQLSLTTMKGTQLHVSMKSMPEIRPLSSLKVLELRDVCFDEDPRSLRAGGLEGVAREWKRVFPHIRHIPCVDDANELMHVLENNSLILEADGNGGLLLSDTNRSIPTLDDGEEHVPRRLRRQLWKLLDYSATNLAGLSIDFDHRWKSDLEIELFGWPVVSMRVYNNPEMYYYPADLT